jgi:hypothetical protein
MAMFHIFTVLFLSLVFAQEQCHHAGGPVKQATIIHYLKELIQPNLPYHIPGIEVDIENGFSFKAMNIYLNELDFTDAAVQLVQTNTVLFMLDELKVSLGLNWEIHTASDNKTTDGVANLNITNAKGSITAFIEPNYFKNTNATFVVGNLVFTTTDQPFIQPYWNIFEPIVVDVLQREIPNLFLEIDTTEIKELVFPIVKSLEPIKIPDQNATVGFVYGAFTNMILNNIDFASATMGRGANDNEVVFELTAVSGIITNNWEFKALGIDDTGDGTIILNSTTILITVGLGQDSAGEFTINLDNAKIDIGGVYIHVDGGGSEVINFLISYLTPIVIGAIEDTFQIIVCILFNGIPSIFYWF